MDRTETEGEPARIMHLAWFVDPPEVGAGMFTSTDCFVKSRNLYLLRDSGAMFTDISKVKPFGQPVVSKNRIDATAT